MKSMKDNTTEGIQLKRKYLPQVFINNTQNRHSNMFIIQTKSITFVTNYGKVYSGRLQDTLPVVLGQ